MQISSCLAAALLCAAAAHAQSSPHGTSLHGTITDPSGAAVPGATIELQGPGGGHRTRTGNAGQYGFASLMPGRYRIRIRAKGFSAAEKSGLEVERATILDVQLTIEAAKQVVNVGDALGRVSADPAANAGAVVMRRREFAALSDDPDELALQLQALAGPAPGPNGGEIFIDGFTGGTLPPKSSIREVRINTNPFSPEYDRPGFSRVEVFTKPGSESLHGQAFAQYNDQGLNTRNPLLASSTQPPYQAQLYGLNLTGPLRRNKATFAWDADHRRIAENAFILATTLDSSLNPVAINQALPTPERRTMISQRLDYALTPRNTLAVRYQELRFSLDNYGVGDFNLPSRAYNAGQTEHTLQVTQTAAISARAVNETRFQFMQTAVRDTGAGTAPVITVVGAFSAGGAEFGDSRIATGNWELTNISSYTRSRHTLKWGGRLRESRVDDTALGNFGGTFTFYTLAQYRQTLMLQPGAGPSQFSLNTGTPRALVNQVDAGVFVNDDWHPRSNVTVSFGLRYEAQTNLGDAANWAPRVAVAWGLGAHRNRPAKTAVRAGLGSFYDRIPASVTLNARRYNGVTLESFLILNPAFFPEIPSTSVLESESGPQQLRPASAGMVTPRLHQGSLGIERQLGAMSRVAVVWTSSRGTHLLDTRNVNTPIAGAFPFGDRSIRMLTESAGLSRQNQVTATVNGSLRKLTLWGYYSLSYGRDDNEGPPADPYNLRAEWGPSAYGDVRHRAVLGLTPPALRKITLSSFFVVNSGLPYNITTGLDPNATGFPAVRPALLRGVDSAACSGTAQVYTPAYGCFDTNPAPGIPAIGHNWGRGPSAVNLALRVSRTWGFGGERPAAPSADPHGAATADSGRKYSVTVSASTLNALNHPNFAPPDGDLSSPYFGQYRSLGGLIVMQHGGPPSTYNRKIDLQVRFGF